LNIVGLSNDEMRSRWVAAALSRIPSGSRILDAGAGEQRNRQWCKHLRYVSQDFGQYEGTGDGRGIQTGNWNTSQIDINSDITAIPEPDGSFDALVCTEVLEHVPDPLGAVQEFSRLLRPGGMLILTAPFCSLTHFAPYHFTSGFNRYWYERHLAAQGFEVVEISSNGNWFHYVAQELWRLPYMGKTYSWRIGGWLALLSALPVLGMLTVLGGKLDRGSEELLSYGWLVIARRCSTPVGKGPENSQTPRL
jgi:SAM-dependent methyltransferase